MPDPGTVNQLLLERATSQPDAMAIADSLGGLTYAATLALVSRVGSLLRAQGIQPGQRVAFASRSSPACVRWILGIGCHASLLPVDPALDEPSVTAMLSRVQASLLVLDGPGTDQARAAATALGIPLLEVQMSQLCARLESGRAADAPSDDGQTHTVHEVPGPQSEWLVLSSSGTTGRPKLVSLSHESMMWRCAQQLHPDQVMTWRAWVNPMPMYHAFGTVGLLKTLISGGTFCALDGFDPVQAATWIRRLDADVFGATPLIYSELLRAMDKDPLLLRDWRPANLSCGSAALSPQLLTAILDRFRAPVQLNYGMTEGALTVQVTLPGSTASESVGRCDPGMVRVVDATGRSVPLGEAGEVAARGPTFFKGYIDDPELNQKAFRDGWFFTGDLGRLDELGNLSLTGRSSLLVNRGGAKVSPAEIEAWLQGRPGVRLAVALGVPHVALGEDLVAAVVPHEGMSLNTEALRDAMLAELPGYKVPSRIVPVEALPLGPAGKVRREGLAAQLRPLLARPHRAPSTPVERHALDVLAQALRVEAASISMDANFFELGGHSLLAARMIAALQAETGQRVALGQFMSAPTALGLASLLQSAAQAVLHPAIEPFRLGDGVPLFCLPGYEGHAHYVRTLMPFLPPTFPVMGVSADVWGPDDPAPIARIAAHCVARIKEVQTNGPYRLMGYSFGGIVAHEVACQLQAQGASVESLVLLDSSAGLDTFADLPVADSDRPRSAVSRHLPGLFDGEIILFRTWSMPLRFAGIPALGWEYLARQGVAVFDMHTTHNGLIQSTSMAQWGPLLARVLESRRADVQPGVSAPSGPQPDQRVPWQSMSSQVLRARRDANAARWGRLLLRVPALIAARNMPACAADWLLDMAPLARPWSLWKRLTPWLVRRWTKHQPVQALSFEVLKVTGRLPTPSELPEEGLPGGIDHQRPETRLLMRAVRQHLAGDAQGARVSMDQLEHRIGDRDELRIALVHQLMLLGWYEEMRRQADRLPAGAPASARGELSGLLCLQAKQEGDWASAVQHAQNAVRHLPMIAFWHAALIEALARLGRRDEALRVREQALERFPEQGGYRADLQPVLNDLI